MSAVFPWKVVPLQNIAEQIDYGLTASATDSANGPKFLRITDIQEDRVDWSTVPFCNCTVEDSKKYALMEGDIVFARTGATTGKSFLVRSCPLGSVFASYLIRVRPSTKVVPGYLARFFQTPNYWNQITRSSTGTAQAGVNASNLKKLAVPLPPLEEQHRIAEILDRAEELRSKRGEAIAQLDTLTQAIFIEMFGAPRKLSNKKEIVPLSFLCHSINDGTHKTPNYVSCGVPFVTVKNITTGRLDFSNTKFISQAEHEELTKRTKPERGDILVSKDGTIGVPCPVQTDTVFSIFVSVALLKPKADIVDQIFLTTQLGSEWVQEQIRAGTKGIAIRHLHLTDFKRLKILLPPFHLQQEFARRVEAVEKLKAAHRASLSELDALFASLQHRAFRGEL